MVAIPSWLYEALQESQHHLIADSVPPELIDTAALWAFCSWSGEAGEGGSLRGVLLLRMRSSPAVAGSLRLQKPPGMWCDLAWLSPVCAKSELILSASEP